jgi:hypothetical protein
MSYRCTKYCESVCCDCDKWALMMVPHAFSVHAYQHEVLKDWATWHEGPKATDR